MKCPASIGIYTIVGGLDLLFQALNQKKKRIKGKAYNKVYMGSIRCSCSPLIYILNVYELFTKTLRLCIYKNIYGSYMCGPVGSYIFLVNYSINLIILIC